MNQHIKDIGKYAAGSLLSLVLIVIAGAITTVAVLIWGFFLLLQYPIGAPHGGGEITVLMNLILQPVSSAIWFVAGGILPVIYFLMGYKYSLAKFIHKIMQNKAENLIYPVLDKFLSEFKQKQSGLVKSGTDYGMKKLQLMESIKQGNGNGLTKRMVIFALKRVKLNDVEMNKEGMDFYEVIKTAVFQQLQQVSKPAAWPLVFILFLQWVALYCIHKLPV